MRTNTIVEAHVGGELGQLDQGRRVLDQVPLLVGVEAEVVRVGVVVARKAGDEDVLLVDAVRAQDFRVGDVEIIQVLFKAPNVTQVKAYQTYVSPHLGMANQGKTGKEIGSGEKVHSVQYSLISWFSDE